MEASGEIQVGNLMSLKKTISPVMPKDAGSEGPTVEICMWEPILKGSG